MSWQRKRLVSFQVTFSSRKSQSQALEKKALKERNYWNLPIVWCSVCYFAAIENVTSKPLTSYYFRLPKRNVFLNFFFYFQIPPKENKWQWIELTDNKQLSDVKSFVNLHINIWSILLGEKGWRTISRSDLWFFNDDIPYCVIWYSEWYNSKHQRPSWYLIWICKTILSVWNFVSTKWCDPMTPDVSWYNGPMLRGLVSYWGVWWVTVPAVSPQVSVCYLTGPRSPD